MTMAKIKPVEKIIVTLPASYWHMVWQEGNALVKLVHDHIKEDRQELLQELTEGVTIGTDGQRNCYFIPCERIDDTIKALQDNK